LSRALPVAGPWKRGRSFTRVESEGAKFTYLAGTGGVYSYQKDPGEALFNVLLSVENVVAGSSWRLERVSDGSAIASGVAAASSLSISVPYAGSNFTVRLKLRQGTTAPKQLPFEAITTITPSGGSIFAAQQPDPFA